jgi:hypothetical protein
MKKTVQTKTAGNKPGVTKTADPVSIEKRLDEMEERDAQQRPLYMKAIEGRAAMWEILAQDDAFPQMTRDAKDMAALGRAAGALAEDADWDMSDGLNSDIHALRGRIEWLARAMEKTADELAKALSKERKHVMAEAAKANHKAA